MKHIQHTFTQTVLLNKRITKQPVFLVLLALIPVLVLGVRMAAGSRAVLSLWRSHRVEPTITQPMQSLTN